MTEGSSRSTTSVSSPAWAAAMPRLRPTSPPPTTTSSWVSPPGSEEAAAIGGLWAGPVPLSSEPQGCIASLGLGLPAWVSRREDYGSRGRRYCGRSLFTYLEKRGNTGMYRYGG